MFFNKQFLSDFLIYISELRNSANKKFSFSFISFVYSRQIEIKIPVYLCFFLMFSIFETKTKSTNNFYYSKRK